MKISEIYPPALNPAHTEMMQGLVNTLLIRTNFLSGIRYRLGWRGLRSSCRNGDSWTCRIEGMEGVYGIACSRDVREDDWYHGQFELYYFPSADDQFLESFSFEAISVTGRDEYHDYVRNFLSYMGFKELFWVARLDIKLLRSLDGLWCLLQAANHLISLADRDIFALIEGKENCILKEGDVDQNLPAFDISFPFYEVLLSTLCYNLEEYPASLIENKISIREGVPGKALGVCFGSEKKHVFSEVSLQGSQGLPVQKWEIGDADGRPYPEACWWHVLEGMDRFEESPARDKTKLIILSGYLGAGKTSFVKNFIEYHTRNRRFVAVIQNEIGETGLDARLLEDDYAVLEMDEGCVCCSLLGQLNKGISQILDKHNPDVIILETSGLANPFNLLEELKEGGQDIDLQSVTTVVDAAHFKLSTTLSAIALEQVLAADTLLLNKVDQVDKGEVEDLHLELHRLNSKADVFSCRHGDINPALLYGQEDEHEPVDGQLGGGHNHMDDHLVSRKLSFDQHPARKEFEEGIKALKGKAFRIKGVMEFRDEPEQYLFQYVNGDYELSILDKKINTTSYIILIGKLKEVSGLKQSHFFKSKSSNYEKV